MYRKFVSWVLAGVASLLLIGISSPPAAAIVVEFQASNVTIVQNYASGNIEDPALGTQLDGTTVGCPSAGHGTVREWRDSDSGGAPDWTPTGTVQGSTDQAWLRDSGASISTTTTVPSEVVTFHLEGDNNDGRTDLFVDATLVATLDMWDAGNNRVLVIVDGLVDTTHTLLIDDLGLSNIGGAGDDDIAAFGGAVLGCNAEIPTLSQWGLIILGLLLLAAMFLAMRRGVPTEAPTT